MSRPAVDRLDDAGLERELRAAFDAGAEALAPVPDPWARTTRAVARSRSRRRAGWAASLASVAVLSVGVVAAVPGGSGGERWSLPAFGLGSVTSDDVLSWPARGDRARDEKLREQLRQALAARHGELVSVLYAGRLGDRDVAVVAADVTGADPGLGLPDAYVPETAQTPRRVVVAFRVEPGVAPDAWRAIGQKLVQLNRVTVALQDAAGRTDLLVLARTDASVAVSTRATPDAEGRPLRRYTKLHPKRGVAITRLGRVPLGSLTVRTLVPGHRPLLGPPDLSLSDAKVPATEAALTRRVSADARCGGVLSPADVGEAVGHVALTLGDLDPPRQVVPLWCRRPGSGAASREGLLAVETTDGTALQVSLVADRQSGGDVTVPVVRRVPPDALLTHPAVVIDELASRGVRIFVHAPGAAGIRLVRQNRGGPGGALVTRATPDGDGFAELAVPSSEPYGLYEQAADAQVELLDATGRVTARLAVADAREDFDPGYFVDGPVS